MNEKKNEKQKNKKDDLKNKDEPTACTPNNNILDSF